MTTPLKNPNLFSKMFSCLCATCKTEFCIMVNPTSEGKAVCPSCGGEKIFIQNDGDKNGDFLFA